MAHLEKVFTLSTWAYFGRGRKTRMAIIIKFGNEEIDTNRTHLNYNLHNEKDGLSDYDFVKNRAMDPSLERA